MKVPQATSDDSDNESLDFGAAPGYDDFPEDIKEAVGAVRNIAAEANPAPSIERRAPRQQLATRAARLSAPGHWWREAPQGVNDDDSDPDAAIDSDAEDVQM